MRVHRSVAGQDPLVFYNAFSGPKTPLSEALNRLGWIVVSRDVLLGPLRDLTDPGVLAQEIGLILKLMPTGSEWSRRESLRSCLSLRRSM